VLVCGIDRLVHHKEQIGFRSWNPVDPKIEQDLLIVVIPLAKNGAEQSGAEGKVGPATHFSHRKTAGRQHDIVLLVISGEAEVFVDPPEESSGGLGSGAVVKVTPVDKKLAGNGTTLKCLELQLIMGEPVCAKRYG